ncbi:DUF445 family protein [Staphylococcus warneri]|uniref:DUF445 domain-containing protein n=1 Tax=Staphylococcus TaxID=1279 RepID=UPI0001A5CDD0|nr:MULTISPECIES: DUF445 family protein [Staphylococcus]MBE9428079.1 DUF445 domain-containing protein [Staphylococcus epidermidis]AXV42050.1 hypothetical protein Ssp1_10100 [Staphylococcus sp. M0911]EEQ78972.1 hypothetical protein STAWA0001_1476 [Staphylococcus warneri L37603]MBO0376689.1 DUF445 domain-containing protein [Staphylococcus warneri]MCD8803072.1 DUF445 family protein [Staphylococcus warneri]
MHALLIILFMMVVGAVIGGLTNVIAIKMLFHPFNPYYIFKIRVPFTPGLIPKRRDEIANKIGQVIEEHLLTEDLMRQKLNDGKAKSTINDIILKQIQQLKADDMTIHYIAEKVDFNIDYFIEHQLHEEVESMLMKYYRSHQQSTVKDVLPQELIELIEERLNEVGDLICERARVYLSSPKGTHDINDMLETFFNEKGKIVGLLQMFMTRESIADRIQQELIRLTNHPKAKSIIDQVINNEFETLKQKQLGELVSNEQFENIATTATSLMMTQFNLQDKIRKPINELAPQFIHYLENELSSKLTDIIINQVSNNLTTIMHKINLRQLVEDQINTFDLDYIEKIIIDIANKELKLIMSLGFILGGIIGIFQGIVAIFV